MVEMEPMNRKMRMKLVKDNFKKDIKAVLLVHAAIFLFIVLILPLYRSFNNIEYINNPKINDFYIINSKKLNKKVCSYIPSKTDNESIHSLKNILKHQSTFYYLFQISSVEKDNIVLKFNGLGCSNYYTENKLLYERYIDKRIDKTGFDPAEEYIVISKKILMKLNFLGPIESIHRKENNNSSGSTQSIQ